MAVRWGRPGNYQVLVYDGGNHAVGERMVEHIRSSYRTRRVDYLVSSHPCPAHSEGLAVLMTHLQVGQLWMHRDPRGASEPGSPRHAATAALEQWAKQCSVPVREPFAGALIGPFTALSPDRAWYEDQLAPAFGTKRGFVTQVVDRAARLLRLSLGLWSSQWNIESFPVSGASAECESSAVLYGEFAGRGVLLTGGAGCGALERACASAEALGIELPHTLKLLQIPNRGRTGNVSSALLDRLLGPRVLGADSRPTKSAFVSLPQQASLLECRLVAAALRRRGVVTFATQGKHLHHSHDMPERDWPPARAMHPDSA